MTYSRVYRSFFFITLLAIGSICSERTTEFNHFFLPFPEVMEGHSFMRAIDVCMKTGEWQTVKRLYTKNLIDDFDWSHEPRIPKIIHHIWLGSPLPEKCKVLRDTWLMNHPGWEFRLWTDQDVQDFQMENKELFDASSNWGEKSDIWRYEIIYRYGGLYVDTDFESIQPMDLFHHALNFYAGIYINQSHGKSPKVVMGNGMIAASPRHPIMRAAIDGMKNAKIEQESSSAILSRTGPYYFTRTVLANAGKNGLRDVILPPMFVYPTPISGRNRSLEDQHKDFCSSSTFANHVWHMSWIKPKKAKK